MIVMCNYISTPKLELFEIITVVLCTMTASERLKDLKCSSTVYYLPKPGTILESQIYSKSSRACILGLLDAKTHTTIMTL